MTTAEKIKFYRTGLSMTQKELAEKTGISEISIRKYEAGERNPKPEQLRKISSALEIGENVLIDIDLKNIQLETVGDLASILFMLKERLGMSLVNNINETDEEGIKISFENHEANELLKLMYDVEKSHLRNIKGIDNLNDELRDDEVTFYKTSATSYPDSVKYNLCNNKQGLFDDEKK